MRNDLSRIFSLCLVCSVVVLAGCSDVPYSGKDKLAMGVFCTAAFADGWTTAQAIDRGGREGFPLMPDRPGDGSLALFQLAKFGVLWTCGEVWPEKREQIWYIGAAFSGGYAVWNSQVEK